MLKYYFSTLSVLLLSLILVLPALAQEFKLGAPGCPDQAAAPYDQGYKVFYESHALSNCRNAMTLLEEHVKLCPQNKTGWALLSFVYWKYGDNLPLKDKKAREELFVKGEAAADQSLKLDPNYVDGIFWKTTNMAAIADMRGIMANLRIYPTLKKNMERIDELKPHFFAGGTARFWCELMARVPLFLVGRFGVSVPQKLALIEEEIKLEPRFYSNRVYAARALNKAGNRSRALEHLAFVLSHDPSIFPEEKGDNEEYQRMAHKVWRDITGKDYPQQ